MKNTTNVFLKGMRSDMHPLSTSQQEYTDALNATLITFNGNEQMMQNDMGNTKIQDSKTGNLMSLREGFVPVGLKEHGGIMYIASVNKDGVGEIGTIPSPVIRYNKQKDYKHTVDIDWSATPSSPSSLYKITDEKLHTGDKFATILQLVDDQTDININYIDPSGNILSLQYPQYSYQNEKRNEHTSNKGLYSINLFAQTDDQVFDMSDQIQAKAELFTYEVEPYQYHDLDPDIDSHLNKKYWFVNLPDDYDATLTSFNIDNMLALNEVADISQPPFITYPNIPAGYPSIQLKTENINSFELSTNKATGHIHPLTKYIPEEEIYYAIFPYFIYSTDSAVHIDEIEVCVFDDDGTQQLLYRINNEQYEDPESSLTFTISKNSERYQIESDNTSNFAIANSELNSITTETDFEFDTDDSHALFVMKVGDDLNKWYTLNVKYKSNKWDEILGEYNLRFNQFVMDIEGLFIDVQFEQEKCNQIYDKSKDISEKINLSNEYYIHNQIYDIDLDYKVSTMTREGFDYLDISQEYKSDFMPLMDIDVNLDYLYGLSGKTASRFHSFRQFLEDYGHEIPYGRIFVTVNNTGTYGSNFWKLLQEYDDGVRNQVDEFKGKSFSCIISFKGELYDDNNTWLKDFNIPSQFNFQITNTWSHTITYDDLVIGGGIDSSVTGVTRVQFSVNCEKLLEELIKESVKDYESDNVWNQNIFKVRMYIEKIGVLVGPTPISGHSAYETHYIIWPMTRINHEPYSKCNCTLTSDNGPGGGTGSISVIEYENDKPIGGRFYMNQSYEYDPYTESNEVNNQGKYEITHQCNLEGKDKISAVGNYIKYGVTTKTYMGNPGHDISLYPCLINTNESKISIEDTSIFQNININNYTSSFIPDFRMRKLKNDTINLEVPIALNPGVYYLGSVIRQFNYSVISGGSINIGGELVDDGDIDNINNYISIKVIPQVFGGDDGPEINMKIASPGMISTTSDSDYYSIKSGREGGILYLPYGGSITQISNHCSFGLLLIQDIGLYEIDLSEFDADHPLFQKVNNTDTAFYTPNRYIDSDSRIYYGYYYVSPQLCWTFDENIERGGIECIKKTFKTLNFGLHAYQTNFGEYFYNPGQIWQIIDLPNGDRRTITFREENNESD